MPSDKQSLADMRKQLRELRKSEVKPISRLKKADVAAEIERLSGKRETVPPVASTPAAPVKKVRSAAESLKEAKISEFQTKPAETTAVETLKKKSKSSAPAAKKPAADASKKKAKLAKLLELMDMESESE